MCTVDRLAAKVPLEMQATRGMVEYQRMSEELDFAALLYYGLAAVLALAAWSVLVRLDIRKPQFSLISLLALMLTVAIAIGVVKLALTFWT